MNLKAIQYQTGYLFVDGTRTTGKICYDDITGKVQFKASHPKYEEDGLTVVAQSPELSIPDIPYVELEEDVEQLAKENNKLIRIYKNDSGLSRSIYISAIKNFKDGYKAAQAKKYTEEDLRKAFRAGIKKSYSWLDTEEDKKVPDENQYIQSLQPKIESIELETTRVRFPKSDDGWEDVYEPVIYQKDGKTFLKVKSINYDKKYE